MAHQGRCLAVRSMERVACLHIGMCSQGVLQRPSTAEGATPSRRDLALLIE